MPVADLSAMKVVTGEGSSATKFNNLVQAVQDEFTDIDPDQIPGYPGDNFKYLRGDGTWPLFGLVPLGDIDLSSTTTFDPIPSGFRSLKLFTTARVTSANINAEVRIRYNNDTGTTYEDDFILVSGASTISRSGFTSVNGARIGFVPGATATANRFGICETLILNYSGGGFKSSAGMNMTYGTSGTADMRLESVGALWENTAAITRIDYFLTSGGVFAAGSRAQLFGVL